VSHRSPLCGHNTEVSLPERVGRLRRVERLGVGGFSSVWLYRDDELRSDVAVKALADNWAQRIDIRERFLEEARILRAADSDHVVRVYDVGEADGTPYFVMTYADRGTVADLLQEGRQPLPRVVSLVRQAGDGLAVLHAKGVVHRDIKPQNLLLTSDGLGRERLMVADLGVAKALIHASGLTQVVGTPAYMAPEQAVGGGVDERADVHGLAAVAYHLLTGHVARDGSVSDLTRAKLPPAPSVFLDDVPPGVDAALLRGLEPDRADRWPDVTSFVEALASCAPDASTTGEGEGRSVTVGPRPSAATDRGMQMGLLVALCLVVALAMFGASYAVVNLFQ
jgi:eukaryotic-like serine/threonine-protein kinase